MERMRRATEGRLEDGCAGPDAPTALTAMAQKKNTSEYEWGNLTWKNWT